MKASYHTHTYRCRHAFGSEEEYILKAIAEGVKILGFADHAPMPYKDGYLSSYKMRPKEIGDYFSTLTNLREKYRDKIEIKIGFETEYYPSMWEGCLEFWRPYPIDYLILGQHFAPEEERGGVMLLYAGKPHESRGRVRDYVDCVIAGMNTGLISYVAHPDLINYTGGDNEFYLSEMRRLISEAVRLDIPLEYNLLGMSDNRSYPNPIFWKEAASLGAKVVLGCDSHSPDRVVKQSEIEEAKSRLSALGIEPLDEIKTVKPF